MQGKRGAIRRIFPEGRELRWALPIFIILILALVQWQAPGWNNRIEAWTVDARFHLRGPEIPKNPIIILALDEASFQILGDLQGENIRTWPRSRWAELLNKIAGGAPGIIALDVVFDTPGWDANGDTALAEAISDAGTVILAAHIQQPKTTGYRSATFSPPLPKLEAGAAGWGVANYPTDGDGGVRWSHLLWPWETQVLPAFPVAAAVRYHGSAIDIDFRDLGGKASLPINFRGPESTFETISLAALYMGEISPDIFKDAIVLVGFTTVLEQDRHLTPFAGSTLMPGVEIHANVIDNLLTGDWLRPSPDWLAVLFVIILGVLGFGIANLSRPLVSVFGVLLIGILYLTAGQASFAWGDRLLPISSPIISLVLTSAGSLAERMVFAEQDKRRLRQRFAAMMSPERLRIVMEQWESLQDAQRPAKEAAVMFADLRGFTHATESLMHQGRSGEMVAFLSKYLDAMSAAIFHEGGVIYRMVGDGLLVMFGMPEPVENYPLRAARAGVRMSQAMQSLSDQWPLTESPARMGIGIHHGMLVDAILGRGRQVDYAIIGDAANTAARIEAHTKVVMDIPVDFAYELHPGTTVSPCTTILISDELYRQIADMVIVQENIPPFEARGKEGALRVVRLLGLRQEEFDEE